MYTKFIWKRLKGIDHLGDLDIDGNIKFKRILKKCGVRMWLHWQIEPQMGV
jgi:hypothetical protein